MSFASTCSDSDVYFHNRTEHRKLRRGDLIEIDRGIYKHWAVYIGGDEVVHLSGDENDGLNANFKPHHLLSISGTAINKAKVCKETLWDVLKGSKMYINNSKDRKWSPFHSDEIVKNALSCLDHVGYSIITKNCEHFAKWCRYGKAKSDQVDNALTGVAVAVAGAAVLGLVHALSKYGGNHTHTEDSDDDDDYY